MTGQRAVYIISRIFPYLKRDDLKEVLSETLKVAKEMGYYTGMPDTEGMTSQEKKESLKRYLYESEKDTRALTEIDK